MSNYDSDQDVTNRKASPKSKFVEPDNKSASGSVTDSNARKRTSAEPIDYPRRRATIAVSPCQWIIYHSARFPILPLSIIVLHDFANFARLSARSVGHENRDVTVPNPNAVYVRS